MKSIIYHLKASLTKKTYLSHTVYEYKWSDECGIYQQMHIRYNQRNSDNHRNSNFGVIKHKEKDVNVEIESFDLCKWMLVVFLVQWKFDFYQ